MSIDMNNEMTVSEIFDYLTFF